LRCVDRRRFRFTHQEDSRMDATVESAESLPCKDYSSRPGALVWFFRKSRDQWKRKHQDLKATVKGYKNQIAAVTKSREQWRLRVEQANERVRQLEAEIAGLRAQIVAQEKKKRTVTAVH
jgi:hypothetical protein